MPQERALGASECGELRLEPLPQRLYQRRLGDGEGTCQHLRCYAEGSLQLCETPVFDDLITGEGLLRRNGRRIKAGVARHQVEELVIQCRDQDSVQFVLNRRQVLPKNIAAGFQREDIRHLRFDRIDIGDQPVGLFTDAIEALLLAPLRLQRTQFFFECPVRPVDLSDHLREVVRLGGRQPRGRRHQHAAGLCHVEGVSNLRQARIVHPALGLAYTGKREPAHKTGSQRERHRTRDHQLQLRGDTRRYSEEPEWLNHGSTSCNAQVSCSTW